MFNYSASTPHRIKSKSGDEAYKLLVVASWDNTRYDPNDIKYTCDWD